MGMGLVRKIACICLSTRNGSARLTVRGGRGGLFATAPLATTTAPLVSSIGSSSNHLTTTAEFASATALGSASQNDDIAMASPTCSSWRLLLEGAMNKCRTIRGSNYVQLATVDPVANEPRVRTVVFRGFLPVEALGGRYSCDGLPCIMRRTTDLRSNKAAQQLSSNDNAELVWWFPTSNEQFRIRGKVVLVGGGAHEHRDAALSADRIEQWQKITDASRESFLTGRVPGEVYLDEFAEEIPAGGKNEDGSVILPPPDNFGLLLLLPNHVDYLRLVDGMYRQVDTMHEAGNGEVTVRWKHQRINP